MPNTPDQIVASLSLEQKAALTNGADFWHTVAIEQVELPQIMMTDGPNGLRKQGEDAEQAGIGNSVPATCFPPAVALGSTWDATLAERVGAAIGEEAQAEQVAVVLGPGINIKRSPLCGRNFEYLSEDPLVAGVLGAGIVRGLQSQGVGASLKHFAANNQEADRMRVSAEIDPRPLREIYLRGFERVVRDARPWTVMCSYNKINGTWASENHWLLTQVLRDEWGFDGLVVSDWGAVANKGASVAAGLDLEMPGSGGVSAAKLVAAVRAGEVPEAAVDAAAARVVALVQRAVVSAKAGASYDVGAHHDLAREVAAASVVLLKNEGGLLPVAPGSGVGVVGEFARTPRYQGAGSSQIVPTRLDSALDSLAEALGAAPEFAPGYTLDDAEDAALAAEAVALAGRVDTVVCFLGVPAALESEGFDRADIELPAKQTALLDALLAVNPRVVVVLSNGGVVRLSGFAERVPAIVEGWLLGQAGGSAIADVLTGRVNPSGRLAETVPVRLEDSPAFLDFPGEHGKVRYGEGLFVGYRWYEARSIPVSFPFGHGLSYTQFEYSDLRAEGADGGIRATLRVRNSGERDGQEVVQLYVARPGSGVVRAPKTLAAFTRVFVPAGETREVTLRVQREELQHWDVRVDRWVVEPGAADVVIGASSVDSRLRATVQLEGDTVRVPLTMASSIGELVADPVAGPVLRQAMVERLGPAADEGMMTMMASMPIDRVGNFGMGASPEQLQQLVELANSHD